MPIAIKNDKTDLSSEKQTEELALKFLNKLKPGNKVFLYGEMGVGKTTFVRYLINGFQKKNKLRLTEVTSPTFNLLSEYNINNLTITASGGPFIDLDVSEFKNIKSKHAIKHPTWEMGEKITIDSSTLMNKGLEVIEAKFLFNIEDETSASYLNVKSLEVLYFEKSFIKNFVLKLSEPSTT